MNIIFPLFWLAGEIGWWIVPVWYVFVTLICLTAVRIDSQS